MTEFFELKKNIIETGTPEDLTNVLLVARNRAALYCMKTCPDEVFFEDGKLKDMSICGMISYLESEVDENDSLILSAQKEAVIRGSQGTGMSSMLSSLVKIMPTIRL